MVPYIAWLRYTQSMLRSLVDRILPELPALRESNQTLSAQNRELGEALLRLNASFEEVQRDRATPRGPRPAGDIMLQMEVQESEFFGGSGPAVSQPINVKERWWEMELALEDRGWTRQIALAQTEFSRYGLNRLMLICRMYAIKNPLIKRGIAISCDYVFGRGIEIRCEDDAADQVIQQFILANERELSHTGLVQKEHTLHTDGNLFFVFFSDDASGEIMLRTIDATEIVDILTDPDDLSQPRFYLRRWQARLVDESNGAVIPQSYEKYYPAIGYDPAVKIPSIAQKEVLWDTPVLHEKVGGLPKWLFGCPDVYAAIDWARAVTEFLSHWATIAEALARFAWNVETKGGTQAIQSLQQTLQTTLMAGGQSPETNPPAVTGSTFITGPGNKLTPIKTAGMQTDAEQCRRLVLMVAAAFGLPETFFGDASTGSLATAVSLDRPTELKFMDRQEAWKATLSRICMYVLERNYRSPGKLREARLKAGSPDLSDIGLEVAFPAVLEHDIAQTISAIVQGASLGGFTPATMDIRTVAKLILRELAVDDPDAVIEAIWPEDSYDPSKNMGLPEPPPTQVDPATGEPKPQPGARTVAPSFSSEARMLEAINSLRRASERILAQSK